MFFLSLKRLPITFNSETFFFNRFSGNLLIGDFDRFSPDDLSLKQKSALDYVENPFLIKRSSSKKIQNHVGFSLFTKTYARLIVFVCKKSFWLAKLFALIPFSIFNDTKTSIEVFRTIFPDKNMQTQLCLPRVIFAISTSKSFSYNGVCFIGVFLPTKRMHAWIIEDGFNPDSFDDEWIHYSPVCLISRSSWKSVN